MFQNNSFRPVCAAFLRRVICLLALVLPVAPQTATAQTAANFTIVNHKTRQPLSLYNYQGSVILLDFWAYWCGPCQDAAADIEPNITQFYRKAGGNSYGVPVQVISISTDLSDPTEEDDYIQTYGLELVGDDTTGAAFTPYDQGYIPEFVVINGLTNSDNFEPWQIIYSGYGYETNDTVPYLKSLIDSVQGPLKGALQVTISPASAVTGGAQWQVDGGPWQDSAVTLTNLSVGAHAISFSTISGWLAPASQTVTISVNQTSQISASYAPAGALQVTLGPPAVVTAGAFWQLDGGPNWASGTTVSNLSVGSHTVTFSSVNGWTSPASQTVTVVAEKTVDVSGVYVLQTGSLEVTINPSSAVSAGAQWQVDGGALQASGSILANLSVGDHTVTFSAVNGWAPPANQKVEISLNQTSSVTATYSPAGSLEVLINPTAAVTAGARWQVDGSISQPSGSTLSNLVPGTYTVTYTYVAGWTAPAGQTVKINLGQTASATGTYLSAPNGLVLITNGVGTIQHAVWPRELISGKKYTVTAAPARGNIFLNWSGGTNSSNAELSASPAYTFVMEPGLVLQANFVTNLLPGAQGAYSGLFSVANEPREQTNSGGFKLTLASTGKFTGTLLSGAEVLPLDGAFSATGSARVIMPRKHQPSLTANLQLDFGDQTVAGTVTDGNFVAQLEGFRNVFSSANPATAYRGQYTLAIWGTDNSDAGPYGTSFGTVTVNPAGAVSFACNLADGTTGLSSSSVISSEGVWPLYVPLYGGAGSLWAWSSISNGNIAAFVSWINPTNSAKSALYRTGFTNQEAALIGSAYNPAAKPLLGTANGQIILEGGNVPSITNQFTLTSKSAVVLNNSSDTNKLTLTITKTTGVISGSFVNPSNPKDIIKVNGVLLQNQTNGVGYFLGTGQSGAFNMSP